MVHLDLMIRTAQPARVDLEQAAQMSRACLQDLIIDNAKSRCGSLMRVRDWMLCTGGLQSKMAMSSMLTRRSCC